MNKLTLTQELDGLSESKAEQIKAVFQPMIKMLEDFEAAYNELMSMGQTNEKSESAKRLRLSIAKVRIEADKVRKSQKEEYLRAGNAIQGVYNILKFAVADKEEKLKEVETFYEKAEEERIGHVRVERLSEVQKYDLIGQDVSVDFGSMADDVWQNYISGVKLHYETIKEAEHKAEEERVENDRKQKLCRKREMQLAEYAQFVNYIVGHNTTQSEFDGLLLSAKNKKKEYEDEQARIKLENEKLKAEQARMEKCQKECEAALAKEVRERKRVEKEHQEKADRLVSKLSESLKPTKQSENKARKSDDAVSDGERLVYFSEIISSGKDGMQSAEAKNAISKAAGILRDSASKMGVFDYR